MPAIRRLDLLGCVLVMYLFSFVNPGIRMAPPLGLLAVPGGVTVAGAEREECQPAAMLAASSTSR
jgi:hypothetical protein